MKKPQTEDTSAPSPRANPDLVGHADAEATFLDAFQSGRMAHAWMICGPKGIGKATFAYRCARFVLMRAEDYEQDDGGLFGNALPAPSVTSLRQDPEDPVFQRIVSGGHGDLLVVERSVNEKTGKLRSEIVVGDVRGVTQFMSMTSSEGGWRVVIVDAADEMNRNAANALLKVLEEPPARTLLLLVSHNPSWLLPTIRSRCRKLVLRPLREIQVSDIVRTHLPDLSSGDIDNLVTLADGSVGRALSLAEGGGLEVFAVTKALLDSLPHLDIPTLHAFGDKIARAENEPRYRVACDLILWGLSGIIRAASGDTKTVTDPHIVRLAGTGGLDRWLEVWEKTNDLFAQADGVNLDRKQVILNVFLMLERTSRA